MSQYEVWFQNSQILQIIEAKSNKEARNDFNKSIQIKKKEYRTGENDECDERSD